MYSNDVVDASGIATALPRVVVAEIPEPPCFLLTPLYIASTLEVYIYMHVHKVSIYGWSHVPKLYVFMNVY